MDNQFDPAVAAAIIQELQEQVAQLQAQVQQLTAGTPQLHPVNPPPPPPMELPPPIINPAQPLAPPVTSRMKVATPDDFTGDRSKADAFLSQLYLYFNARPADFPTDGQRILFALSYMKGGIAGAWAARFVEQVEAGRPPAETWVQFRDSFRHTFADPDPGATARIRMSELRQGAHVVDLYIMDFQELAVRTGYGEVAHMECFERGLNQNLLNAIYHMNEMPTTLEAWYKAARKFDIQLRKFEQRRSRPASTPPRFIPRDNTPKPFLPRPSSSNQGPVPMDVDSGLRTRNPPVCYRCRKAGHLIRDCPEKPQKIRAVEESPKEGASHEDEPKDKEKDF